MFTSGRSMSTEELSQVVDKSVDEVKLSLEELQSRIKRRQDSALQLTEVSGRWIFEVRPNLSLFLPESFRPDTPQRLLPAAALIAYHQPMAQSTRSHQAQLSCSSRPQPMGTLASIDWSDRLTQLKLQFTPVRIRQLHG